MDKETKKLDELFSEYIRKRAIKLVGGCEKCLTRKYDIQKEDGSIFPAWKQLQNSHYIGRGNHATRFDEDDCAGLCGACHIYFTANPHEHTKFFQKRLGLRYDLLIARSRNKTKVDVKLLMIYYKQKISEIDVE